MGGKIGKVSRFHWSLLVILILGVFTRFWNLSYPPRYIFDEVYHAFTAATYAQNNPAGYEWWHQSPVKGTAYEWLHPPLSKLFMAMSILIFGDNSFGWRFFSAIFGVVAIYLLYLVAKKMFNERVGLTAAFLGTIDGLFLVQSRIAMNDIFLIVFILATIYWLLVWLEKVQDKYFILVALFIGLACATKWPGVFLMPVVGLALVSNFWQQKKRFNWLKRRIPVLLLSFALVPLIYLASFGQFWLQGHSFKQFIELHKQIWWYQTTLKATHDYASPAWQWPLMIRPVWYFVNYGVKGKIGNIYALGNPIIWWSGLVAMAWVILEALTTRAVRFKLLSLSFVIFWAPWLFSPRVMFLYHYLPSLSFIILSLAWFLQEVVRDKRVVMFFLLLSTTTFIFFYPNWVGAVIPNSYFSKLLWLPSWK